MLKPPFLKPLPSPPRPYRLRQLAAPIRSASARSSNWYWISRHPRRLQLGKPRQDENLASLVWKIYLYTTLPLFPLQCHTGHGSSWLKPFARIKKHMGGCQNYGPFSTTLNIRGRVTIEIQKRTTILTTTHMTERNIRNKQAAQRTRAM